MSWPAIWTEPSTSVVPGREVLLDDQEVALPRRLARGLVAPGVDGDRRLAAERRPG